MSERTGRVPMSDEALDREIEEAMAVDPSPAFLPRVRHRIANEPAATWQPRWAAVVGAIGAIAVAAIVWTPRSSGPEVALSDRTAASPPVAPRGSSNPPAAAPIPAPVTPASPSGPVTERTRLARIVPPSSDDSTFSEVIVSDGQMQAIRRLVAQARETLQPAPTPIVTRGAESNEEIDLPPVSFTQVLAEPVVFEPVLLE